MGQKAVRLKKGTCRGNDHASYKKLILLETA